MRDIRSVDDILQLLDGFFTRGPDWWDGFYADRDKPVPFFVSNPDESLVDWLDRGLVEPGRALDLGCGPGRNAIHSPATASPSTPSTCPRRLTEVELRHMHDEPDDSPNFGEPFLWTGLFRKA